MSAGPRWRSAALLGAVVAVGGLTLLGAQRLLADRLQQQTRIEARRALLAELPPAFEAARIDARVVLRGSLPGAQQTLQAWRLRSPDAWLLQTSSAAGYGGDIVLLIAIDAAGEIAGVATLAHNETAGLGDVIDSARSDWLRQFDGATLAAPASAWRLDVDGGELDAITGATITSRAVLQAVQSALRWFEAECRRRLAAGADT